MMQITAYEFGKIVIGGNSYTSDVVIHPDHVEANWWREQGHNLIPGDLEGVWISDPTDLIVGTGFYGNMKIPDETRAFIQEKGTTLSAMLTSEAVQTFMRLSADPSRRPVVAFHLTC